LNDTSPASPNHLNNGASTSNQPNTLQPQSPNHDSPPLNDRASTSDQPNPLQPKINEVGCSKGKHLNLYLYINIVYLNNYVYLIGLQDIKLQCKIKMCGRPKGASMTTIGLKKKKKGCPISFSL